MDRREALKRTAALLGCAVSAPTLAAVLAGCERMPEQGAAWAPRTLTPEQDELVAVLSDIILPATETPGARGAEVDRFIDAMLTEYYPAEETRRFLEGVAGVDARARGAYGRAFLDCTEEQRLELVAAMDREAFPVDAEADPAEEPPYSFFRHMKELTLVGYYTSPVGAQEELRVNQWGSYRGDVPYEEYGRAWA